MPEQLPGQLSIFDAIKDELVGEPTPSRAIKLLDMAEELGWTLNPYASFVTRLAREDGLPFYFRYDLSFNPETGKRSWKFAGAMAINGQKLNYNDIRTYLEDPSVIFPEPPEELSEAAEHEDPTQTEAGALEALKPLTEPAPSPAGIPAADWGALLNG